VDYLWCSSCYYIILLNCGAVHRYYLRTMDLRMLSWALIWSQIELCRRPRISVINCHLTFKANQWLCSCLEGRGLRMDECSRLSGSTNL